MTIKTPDLSQQEVSKLSPAARDAYFQQKADEGVNPDSWLFGAVQEFIASGKARQQSKEVGDQNVDDLTKSGDVKFVEGLEPSNADYQGYDHEKLEQFIKNDLNVEQVTQVSTAYHDIHKAFETFSTTMTEAVKASEGTWDGDAAGNAKGYFKSLSKWSDANSQNAKLASETIYDQGTAASHVKNTMPAPIPFSWKDEVGGWMTSNPFNLGGNIEESIQKQQQSQDAHREAATAMHSYDKALYDAASKQPVFAEPPKFGVDGEGEINRPMPYEVPPGARNPGDGQPGHGNNPGNTYIPPGNGGGGNGGGGGGGGGGTGHIPGPGSSTGSGSIPSSTTPSGFQNGPAPITTPGPNNNTAMPISPMPMAPPMMGGGMGDSEYNGRGGRSGGGSGFGPGGGSGSTPGSGSASGAARPGGVGAAEAAAGRGMGGLGGGAAGRGGPGMGGGMGGRGQQSDGDEDTEHQRPTYLVEGDPDEVFGTDMRTAPPVIGE
ncbi:hypothetical protein GCM10027598_06700 [Amycolatopsis oliviviridis]|uniref:PPE family domain-containing protein n=1 Tax=Amycolatopsis oliviviridis TaxID=1471590 RepID=A0ABQ3LPP0_9PSEU|nr:hypothetical protein [Amycolatopsis oliviviridis]GHH20340.1 hypothetical protein GCM10017790_40100 [Amycolatopsis oliviviridis]